MRCCPLCVGLWVGSCHGSRPRETSAVMGQTGYLPPFAGASCLLAFQALNARLQRLQCSLVFCDDTFDLKAVV